MSFCEWFFRSRSARCRGADTRGGAEVGHVVEERVIPGGAGGCGSGGAVACSGAEGGCCLVVRAAVLLVLVPLVNLAKKLRGYGDKSVSFGVATMMWHSQLRGGLTIMMVLSVHPIWTKNKETMVTGRSPHCDPTGPSRTVVRNFAS